MPTPLYSWLTDPLVRTEHLERTLPPDYFTLLRLISDAAAARGLPLYLVGGFVRDLYLGRPVTDFDVVVEGDAIALAKALAAQHGGRVTVHVRFGTAQWFLPESLVIGRGSSEIPDLRLSTLDIISARSETYKHPAALPTVRPGSISDDLHRRDFTINTLALRLDGEAFGELRDDLGGLEDLQAEIVRVIHPGSFLDDPTRLFRALRYEQRYGFQIAPETLSLIPAARPLIAKLSAERVRHELDLTLEEENAASIVERLAELGILAAVHPALGWNRANATRFVKGMAAEQDIEHPLSRRMLGWTLWLMDVPLPSLENIEQRLHFESSLRDLLLAASALFADVKSFTGKKPSRCVVILDEIPLKAVQAVSLALTPGTGRQMLRDYLVTWRHVKPKTTGHTLLKRGIPPGPMYQKILGALRDAWLDGEIKTEAEEMDLLQELIQP